MAKADYEVGYGKPPKSGQFQKGESGNRGGVRKRPASYQELVDKVLAETVNMTGKNGKKVAMSQREGAIRNLSTKAMQGNIGAWMALHQTRSFGSLETAQPDSDYAYVFTLLLEEKNVPGPHTWRERLPAKAAGYPGVAASVHAPQGGHGETWPARPSMSGDEVEDPSGGGPAGDESWQGDRLGSSRLSDIDAYRLLVAPRRPYTASRPAAGRPLPPLRSQPLQRRFGCSPPCCIGRIRDAAKWDNIP